MTISVTSLGTAQAKSSLGATLSGVSVSAGDWIIVSYAGDTSSQGGSATNVGPGGATMPLYRLITNLNTGNVETSVWVGRASTDSSSCNITVVGVSNQSSAIAVYKATNLDYSISGADAPDAGGGLAMYGGGTTRAGNRISSMDVCTWTSAQVKLSKTGSPTGTISITLRKVSDDSLIGTLGTMAAADLTTTGTYYTFNGSVSNTPVQDCYMLVEFSGGDGSNYVNTFAGGTALAPYYLQVTYSGGSYTSSWPSMVCFKTLTGVKVLYPLDKTSSGTGSSTTPSSGATATTSQADELLVGSIGTEGPNGDTAGTWGTDVDQNTQRLGTTGGGDAGNITVASAAEVKSATGTFTASKSGITSRDWAAIIVTLREGATTPTITVDTGIASAEAFGTPTVSGAAITVGTGIASAEAFGTQSIRPVIAPATGIASAEAFGQPTLTKVDTITVGTGIASAEAFTNPTLTLTISGAGNIASAEAFGTQSLQLKIAPSTGIATAEAFGNPTLTTYSLITGAGNIATAEAFGTPGVQLRIAPATGIASAEAFGTQSIQPRIAPATGIASAEAFGNPTFTLTIAPPGIASAEAFGTQSLVLNIVGAGNIASAEAFGNATVSTFGDTISNAGNIASAEAFGTQSIRLTVAPSVGIASAEAFGTATITKVDVITVSTGIASAEAFGNPTIAPVISGAGNIASAAAFGTATMALVVSPPGIASAEAFGTTTVTTTYNIYPASIASAEAFETPIIYVPGVPIPADFHVSRHSNTLSIGRQWDLVHARRQDYNLSRVKK